MPVLFSYDFDGADGWHLNKFQCMLERLGWERVGGTSYRYPPLSAAPVTEDWFNHVIPALMLFRAHVRTHALHLSKYSLDVQTSTGHDLAANVGTPPLPANPPNTCIPFQNPTNPSHFGESNLRDWIDAIGTPYPNMP